MPTSEIDDIFASKGKAKAVQPIASISTALPPQRKKKKDKKRKRDGEVEASHAVESDAAAKPPKAKRPVPETVVDSSSQLAPAPSAKWPKVDKVSRMAGVKRPKAAEKVIDDEARFKDSRGIGPRRKTEEGFSIFKEDELGIRPESGETPLCPFDCDCCF
ncbi:hypothetical protein EWM64_g4288 [Hericium alpestre]|uniref:DUF1764-domain-containing protein n=1 Tax=Hericium alpestre TaxID=135208 RepID=A0A4Y9ZZY0_9AGAM|nr:hypothetical protein EWM64_g4288 [Hericium alpestre]